MNWVKHSAYPSYAVAIFLAAVCFSGCGGNDGADLPADTVTTAVSIEAGTDSAPDTYKNGDLFVMDGHASEVLSPVRESMLDYAVSLFSEIYETYLTDGEHRILLSVIPDKNVYLASSDNPDGVPFADYDLLVNTVRDGCADFVEYCDLFSVLSLDDYYHADLHWKQENLSLVTETLLSAFGHTELPAWDYVVTETDGAFIGTYTAQLADSGLSDAVGGDVLCHLENDILSQVTVTDYKDGTPSAGVLYKETLSSGDKSYDSYLSGSVPLQVLYSPMSSSDRELIIFRDSFASALAPLLCAVYREVTLVDLRYLGSGVLDDYLSFDEEQDVLFLYSTHLLNRAMIMK